MQDPTIDYTLQRLSKMIPKHADDPERLSKVKNKSSRKKRKIQWICFQGNHFKTNSRSVRTMLYNVG